MPTQEERLSAVERKQNEQFTMLAGVIGSQGQDIKAMRKDINAMRTDMHSIAATLKQILDRLPPAKE